MYKVLLFLLFGVNVELVAQDSVVSLNKDTIEKKAIDTTQGYYVGSNLTIQNGNQFFPYTLSNAPVRLLTWSFP